ncbi:MAG: PAS domain S-box protein [Myxococcota bacterium]
MTIIDVTIVSAIVALGWAFACRMRGSRALGFDRGLALLFVGLTAVACFYAADLFVLWGMPLFMSRAQSTAAMEYLHLNLSWVEALVSVGAIGAGFAYMLQVALPRLVGERTRELQIASEAFRDSAERYRAFVENATEGIFVADSHGHYVDVNEAACRMTGYSRSEFLAMSIRDLAPASGPRGVFSELKRSGQISGEVLLRKKDGSGLHASLDAMELGEDRYIAVCSDISVRKQVQAQLTTKEAQLRTVMEASPDHIWLLDKEFKILYCNRAGETRDIDELVGVSVLSLLPKERRAESRRHLESALAAKTPYEYEIEVQAADACPLIFENIAIRTELDGQVVGLTINSRNISERRRAEAERERLQTQLHHAQRLESLGRLAGGVAHDINNMLTVIMCHTESGLGRVDSSHPLHAGLREIEGAATHSADLIRGLLGFARKQMVAPRVVDLNDTAAEILTMSGRLIGEDIDLVWRPGAGVWPVRVDPSQIDQILVNLCVNARDAISGVGRVTIETANITFDKAFCARHPDCRPGEYVMLAVTDNGAGMDETTLEHIFDPFFTTKEIGSGTGLGLSTVYGIVEQNGGFICAQSDVETGTVMKVYIPRHTQEVVEAAAPEEEWPRGRGETVLLVEDEPKTLKVGQVMLEELGYVVLAAGSPADALRLAESHAGEFQLLLTDVVMPEMNGRVLAERIRELAPDISCLFMSGYPADIISLRGEVENSIQFIQKPFTIGGLAVGVRGALGEH